MCQAITLAISLASYTPSAAPSNMPRDPPYPKPPRTSDASYSPSNATKTRRRLHTDAHRDDPCNVPLIFPRLGFAAPKNNDPSSVVATFLVLTQVSQQHSCILLNNIPGNVPGDALSNVHGDTPSMYQNMSLLGGEACTASMLPD